MMMTMMMHSLTLIFRAVCRWCCFADYTSCLLLAVVRDVKILTRFSSSYAMYGK